MKLHQFKKGEPCYYCGSISTSREHLPPKMMFEGFDCDCITVPSCEKHNSGKSIGDRAIITAILMGASLVSEKKDKLHTPNHLTNNVTDAIERNSPNFQKSLKEVQYRNLFTDPPNGFDYKIPYIKLNQNVIFSWIKQLTAGWIWAITGTYYSEIEWEQSHVFCPHFIPTSSPLPYEKIYNILIDSKNTEEYFDGLNWNIGWSKYPPDIYSFDLCLPEDLEEDNKLIIGFRHLFYNGSSKWYVWIKSNGQIVNSLRESLKS